MSEYKKTLDFVMLSIITLTLLVPVIQILFVGFAILGMHGYLSPFIVKEVREGAVNFAGNIINLALAGVPISLLIAFGIKRILKRRDKKSFNTVAIVIIVIPIVVIIALIIAGILAGIAACWYCSTYTCPGRVKSCGATWLNIYCECYSL